MDAAQLPGQFGIGKADVEVGRMPAGTALLRRVATV
jgi:hypothetical protein